VIDISTVNKLHLCNSDKQQCNRPDNQPQADCAGFRPPTCLAHCSLQNSCWTTT